MQQRSAKDGTIMRSWKGGPPTGTNMGKFFVLSASQDGKPLPVEINYDKVIWSGLSWAVGEIGHAGLKQGSTSNNRMLVGRRWSGPTGRASVPSGIPSPQSKGFSAEAFKRF